MLEQLITLFLMGLFGAGHCFGMCGSLCAAATLNSGAQRVFSLSLVLSVGRICSYASAGAITAASVGMLQTLSGAQSELSFLRPAAAIMMILAGLYISRIWTGLSKLEAVGATLWRRLQPLGVSLLPIRNLQHAFLFGVLWGWLPCGLVYSALVWSLSSASAVDGALLMTAFGVGTLPALLLSGVLANRISIWLQRTGVRFLLGSMIILMGLYNLIEVMPL